MTPRPDVHWRQENRPEPAGNPSPDAEADGAGPPTDPDDGDRGDPDPVGGDAPGDPDRPDDSRARPAPPDRSEVAELEDRWRRALADLDNLRKRHNRELLGERAAERDRVAAAFLPVVDNIDLALEHAEAAPGAIVEGVRAIREQALAVLAHLGYPRRDDVGGPFDPTRHEVVAVVPTTESSGAGSVVEVVRPGYGDPERLLRPAAVTVARDPEA